MNPCNKKVEYQFPWAGKIVRSCERHAVAMANVAKAIGSPIEFEKLVDCDEKCLLPVLEEETEQEDTEKEETVEEDNNEHL